MLSQNTNLSRSFFAVSNENDELFQSEIGDTLTQLNLPFFLGWCIKTDRGQDVGG